MSAPLVSVDPGNGSTKALMLSDHTEKAISFPSVRARHFSTGLEKSGTGISTLNYEVIEWYGDEYVNGIDVLTVGENVQRHRGRSRYGNEMHQYLVLSALAKLGIPSGEVDLVLYAPPGLLGEMRKTIIDSFENQVFGIRLRRSATSRWRSFEYGINKVHLIGESVACIGAITLDNDGKPIQAPLTAGRVLFVDIGAYTIDFAEFVNNKLNPTPQIGLTVENAGVYAHIIRHVLRQVQAMGGDLTQVTEDHIDLLLYDHRLNYTLDYGMSRIDLTDIFEDAFTTYAQWIASNIFASRGSDLASYSRVFLVGGGVSRWLWRELDRLFPGRFVPLDEYPAQSKAHPAFFNVLGGARLAWARRRR